MKSKINPHDSIRSAEGRSKVPILLDIATKLMAGSLNSNYSSRVLTSNEALDMAKDLINKYNKMDEK